MKRYLILLPFALALTACAKIQPDPGISRVGQPLASYPDSAPFANPSAYPGPTEVNQGSALLGTQPNEAYPLPDAQAIPDSNLEAQIAVMALKPGSDLGSRSGVGWPLSHSGSVELPYRLHESTVHTGRRPRWISQM